MDSLRSPTTGCSATAGPRPSWLQTVASTGGHCPLSIHRRSLLRCSTRRSEVTSPSRRANPTRSSVATSTRPTSSRPRSIGATGRVRTTTALNVGTAGRLPWTELAVRIEGLSGQVPMRWELIPGTRFGQASPWVSCRGSTPIVSLGNQALAVVTSGMGTVTVGPHRVHGEFVAEAGVRELLACTATDGEPVFIPTGDGDR